MRRSSRHSLRARCGSGKKGGGEQSFAVKGGFVEVKKDEVSVCIQQ